MFTGAPVPSSLCNLSFGVHPNSVNYCQLFKCWQTLESTPPSTPRLPGWGSRQSPEHVGPAVRVVAPHLQAYAEDGVHAQDVGRVQPHALQLPDLLQLLLHFQLHCARKTVVIVSVRGGGRKEEGSKCCHARAKGDSGRPWHWVPQWQVPVGHHAKSTVRRPQTLVTPALWLQDLDGS